MNLEINQMCRFAFELRQQKKRTAWNLLAFFTLFVIFSAVYFKSLSIHCNFIFIFFIRLIVSVQYHVFYQINFLDKKF